ncbi:hypothetical protein D3C78_1349170 [compost metagenome]
MGLAQALWVDHHADVDRKAALFLIEIQIDGHHPANFHPEELHRRTDAQATQGLVEAQGQVLRLAIGRGEGALLIGKQLVGLVLAGGDVVGAVLRRPKRDAAQQ